MAFYTASGKVIGYGLGEFRQEHVCLEDIATHLARTNRFGGAGRRSYSVLQHTIFVASLVPSELEKPALLHDAAEAYFGDLVTPLKKEWPKFKELEERFTKTIFAALNLPFPTKEEWKTIKKADKRAFDAEAFFIGPPGLWEAIGARRDAWVEERFKEISEKSLCSCWDKFIQTFNSKGRQF